MGLPTTNRLPIIPMRGTSAAVAAVVIPSGELVATTDTNKLFLGDGFTTGGNPVFSSGGTGGVTGSYYPLVGNPSGYANLGFRTYNLTGNSNIFISGSGLINTFHIDFTTGISGFTGNIILTSGANQLLRMRNIFPLSGNSILNVYNQTGTGSPIFTWTGDNTLTQIFSEYSFSGANWKLDNANFIN